MDALAEGGVGIGGTPSKSRCSGAQSGGDTFMGFVRSSLSGFPPLSLDADPELEACLLSVVLDPSSRGRFFPLYCI